eukprot:CAMPEP_0174885174 /NCGR_PEP_ID=MMETSP0167-20121228/528_1 /TAXON_ID=38298 /ORGANISM="Rhodella maculata, Strain CCMP736" /LENGTH=118 /DNA_ID=CAMNT_0016120689 /DNA_START=9 /DNA_END=362 /DNA_ORIENTATION=-
MGDSTPLSAYVDPEEVLARVLARAAPPPYIPQKRSWDCGVACVAMALNSFGFKVSLKDVETGVAVRSVWTVDLLHYLSTTYPGIDSALYTTSTGVDPAYADQAFYAGSLEEDELRVSR